MNSREGSRGHTREDEAKLYKTGASICSHNNMKVKEIYTSTCHQQHYGAVAAQEIFIWGYSPGVVQGQSPFQKLKQFAGIGYRFWLQKRSKFETFFISHNSPQFVSCFCFFCFFVMYIICTVLCGSVLYISCGLPAVKINELLLLFFYTLGINDPEGFWKKIEWNTKCWSDHYSGQSSWMNDSCSRMLL